MFSAGNSLLYLAAGLLLARPAPAVDFISLDLGRISGPDWTAESVSLKLDWRAGTAAAFSLSAASISHPALPFPLENPVLSCAVGVISDYRISCQKGVLRLHHPALDSPGIPISFDWEIQDRTLHAELDEVRLAGGVMQVQVRSQGQDWSVSAQGKSLDIATARRKLAPYLPGADGLELSGKMDLTASVSGAGGRPARLQWRIDFSDSAFSSADGTYLGEGLAGRWRGALAVSAGAWQGDSGLALKEGAVLTPFAYLGVEADPVSLDARLSLDPQGLELASLDFRHPGLLEFNLAGRVSLEAEPAIERLRLQTRPLELQAVYAAYVQPTQAESLLANLEWSGRAEALLDYVAQGPQRLELRLHDVHVGEGPPPAEEGVPRRRRFALSGLEGRLVWTRGLEPEDSVLAWENGHLLEGISLGAAELDLQLQGESARLIHPAGIPVLDGRLELQVFDLFLEETGPRIEFGGALTPVSMQAFSRAMGWRPLPGKLSGGIPGARYENGVLTLEGAMLASVFNGWIIVRDLRLEDLFGVWPTLSANLELKNLDLEALSSTFSFGKITGRLEGRMDNLCLENWRPVSFDARFATPEHDDSRHRISQRAVDNISNLGGSGVAGALSRTLLGFFDEFGYERLGISCRLENGVCEMDGVEPARQGYYLVKGGGIPRIDIVGFNRRIDWELLIGKLREIIDRGAGEARVE